MFDESKKKPNTSKNELEFTDVEHLRLHALIMPMHMAVRRVCVCNCGRTPLSNILTLSSITDVLFAYTFTVYESIQLHQEIGASLAKKPHGLRAFALTLYLLEVNYYPPDITSVGACTTLYCNPS